MRNNSVGILVEIFFELSISEKLKEKCQIWHLLIKLTFIHITYPVEFRLSKFLALPTTQCHTLSYMQWLQKKNEVGCPDRLKSQEHVQYCRSCDTVSPFCLTKSLHALAPTGLKMIANIDSETAELIREIWKCRSECENQSSPKAGWKEEDHELFSPHSRQLVTGYVILQWHWSWLNSNKINFWKKKKKKKA